MSASDEEMGAVLRGFGRVAEQLKQERLSASARCICGSLPSERHGGGCSHSGTENSEPARASEARWVKMEMREDIAHLIEAVLTEVEQQKVLSGKLPQTHNDSHVALAAWHIREALRLERDPAQAQLEQGAHP